ncbi:MAG: site-specific integrase [Bacteroides sp.]|nr:site-specific integrase [Bacteroides sp.]
MITTVKVKFRPSTVAGHPGSIIYLVTRHRTVRQISTGYRVFPAEWDEKRSRIVPHPGARLTVVQSVIQRVRWDMESLDALIGKWEKLSCDYTSDDVVAEFKRIVSANSLFAFMDDLITRQKAQKNIGTADNYRAALNSFKRYRENEDILIGMMDHRLIEHYQDYLRSIGLTPNSISFHMRILRAVYNSAVRQGLTTDRQPFRTVFTGTEKTRKRAVGIDDVRRIRELDFSRRPDLDYARDLFMFLFLCRGMSFIDAAFLKKTDLRNGIITYRRHKTWQLLQVKVVGEIRAIIERRTVIGSPYLLPIISKPGGDERKQYKSALRLINKRLKAIAELTNLPISLTTYVSRHAWATIAKNKNVPIHVIADALGHNSVVTTQIYLASIDASTIDKANDLIISDL